MSRHENEEKCYRRDNIRSHGVEHGIPGLVIAIECFVETLSCDIPPCCSTYGGPPYVKLISVCTFLTSCSLVWRVRAESVIYGAVDTSDLFMS